MSFDLILKNGTIVDGTGRKPFKADIGLKEDKIARIGNLSSENASNTIDVKGLIVSPGFINMLSWSIESLIVDGRALGTIKQGVTTEIMGEGYSAGPLNDEMKQTLKDMFELVDEDFEIPWTSFGQYLEYLENKGISTNVASFLGTATVRMNVLGYDYRSPSRQEMDEMKKIIRTAMQEGALGIGSALI